MAQVDHYEMREDAHQPLHGSDVVHSGTVNGKRERVDRRQRPTIGQVVYTFLNNIKLRFGEHSTEVITILNILGTFRAREMSKKDTLVALRVTLGDQTDLKQDLLNILFHREADWGVGDFDFGFRQPHDQPSPATASPSVLGVPVAVPIGQPIDEMPPPSKKRRRVQSSGTQAEEDISHVSPTTETADEVFVPPRSKKKVKEESAQSQGRCGPYIHSLCGKGFSSRSGVKKHHWGNKLDNLETTTGCWAKNNKPSVGWNEHPSCREGATQRKAPSKPRTLEQKGPFTPSMVPGSQEPQQPFTDPFHLRRESEQSLEGQGSYHSHRLPTLTSFDNLLTAVNLASQIDAPTPQGRIDSVVSHLDAQAAATEHNRQYIANWQDASGDHEEEALAYGCQHPYTAHGLGLQGVHVPVPMALPGFDRSYPHTPFSYNLTGSYGHNEHSLVFDDTKEHRTALESPFSPDADMEYR